MKKMQVVWLLIMALSLFGTSLMTAQILPVKFGIRGGVNLSDYGGDMKDVKSALRYQVGFTADLGLTENIYLQTGLDFLTKGGKYKPETGKEVKYNPIYLQLPVHVAYKMKVAPGTKVVVNAGPYAAYGLGGKAKGEEKEDIFGKDGFKRFDFGVGAGLGVEFGILALNVGYDWGLANISEIKDVKVKNKSAYITLGLKF
ncbi:MAG: PorT family protein [Prevotella sp.]|jgi:hypothetical protein|nr:PorT family protein [Prevotella sp.]